LDLDGNVVDETPIVPPPLSKFVHAALLLAAGFWISITFLSSNIELGHAILPVLAVGALIGTVALILYFVIACYQKDMNRRRLFAALVGAIVVFNTYGLIFHSTIKLIGFDYYQAGQLALAVWFVIFLLFAGLLWSVTSSKPRELAICIGVGVLFSTALMQTLVKAIPILGIPTEQTILTNDSLQVGSAGLRSSSQLPDVYYFLFDAYAREDQLKRHAEIEITNFLNQLRSMEFSVVRNAKANYLTTNLSVGHLLLSDYFVVDIPTHQKFLNGIGPSSAAEEGWSPVIDQMVGLGYRFVRTGKCTGREDRCLGPGNLAPPEIIEMLHNTPITTIIRYLWPSRAKDWTQEVGIPQTVSALAKIEDRPLFAFMHFMNPHDKSLNADCSVRKDAFEASLAARLIKDRMLEEIGGYRDTVICMNKQIVSGLKKLMNSTRPKIIILAADHGSSFSVPKNLPAHRWPSEALIERAAIFNAWHLPNHCRKHLYDGITPVNHFRLILACITGKDPDFLPDLTYAIWYGGSSVSQIPPNAFIINPDK
jgi:hypothetical protein